MKKQAMTFASCFIFVSTIIIVIFPLAPPAWSLQSDDFSTPALDLTVWDFHPGLGDEVYYSSGTNLIVYLPGGWAHDAWQDCPCAPRFVQWTTDTDFEIEAKFDSKPSEENQFQGLVALADNDTYLRFDILHDGTSAYLFAAFVDGNVYPTTRIYKPIGAVAPSYIRVTRTGDDWALSYSSDGLSWSGEPPFTQALAVAQAGFHFGNAHSAYYRSPTFVGDIDYFYNTATPIAPEDGGAATAVTAPTIDVWYGDNQKFGHLGYTQPLIQIVGRVWDPDGVASATYGVNGGAANALSLGPDYLRLERAGDFVVEFEASLLSPGANTVDITAIDNNGQQNSRTVNVTWTSGVAWSLPDQIVWASANRIDDVAQVVDGHWILTPEGVRTHPSGTGYDRFLLVGEHTWVPDYEVIMPFKIHAGELGNPGGVGIAIGWEGHRGFGQPLRQRDYQNIACLTGFPSNPTLQMVRNGDWATVTTPFPGVQAEVWYNMKLRSETLGNGTSHVGVKVWQSGTSEPVAFQLEDDYATRNGSVMLLAHYMDVTIGTTVLQELNSPTGLRDGAPPATLRVLQNFPNPFSTGTNIAFALPEATDVTIEVFDVTGRRVLEQRLARVASGWHHHRFAADGLPAGVYFYRITTARAEATLKMVVAR